jgi:hypothetical protein
VFKGYCGARVNVNDPGSRAKRICASSRRHLDHREGTEGVKDTRVQWQNLIHLVPDAATDGRVRARARPDTFYIHDEMKDPRTGALLRVAFIMSKDETPTSLNSKEPKIRVVR